VKRIAIAAVAALVFALPATASAATVVGESIDGIKLGQTMKHVRKRLGKPSAIPAPGREWTYPEVRMTFDTCRNLCPGFLPQVLSLSTTSAKQKTSKGIHSIQEVHKVIQPGTGSTEAEVRQAYPGVACTPTGPPNDEMRCVLNSHYHGRGVETAFVIFDNPAAPVNGEVFYIEIDFPSE